MQRIIALFVLGVLGPLGGCIANDAPAGTAAQAVISPNGISLNGISLNSVNLNGISPNGISLNGTPLGIAISGPPLAGADVVGSTWTGHLSDGSTVALRVDDAVQGTGDNADLWSYRLSVSASGTWRPLCLDPAGNASFADTVRGSWNLAQGVPGGGSYDPTAADFTLACRGSAIAKCVELGYKPWTGNTPQLVACVRALRGDYCGDGTPYTVTGTPVNIFDNQGIQADSAAWDPEAEWTPAGARCVSKKKETRFNQDAHQKPWCFPHAVKAEKNCGDGFSGAVVIITELAPL